MEISKVLVTTLDSKEIEIDVRNIYNITQNFNSSIVHFKGSIDARVSITIESTTKVKEKMKELYGYNYLRV